MITLKKVMIRYLHFIFYFSILIWKIEIIYIYNIEKSVFIVGKKTLTQLLVTLFFVNIKFDTYLCCKNYM